MSSRENTGRQEAQTLSRESSRSTVGWDQDSVCHPYEVEKFVGPPALRPSRSCPSLVMKTCPALIITRERREDVEERKELEEVKKERRKEEIQRLEKETKWDEAERNGLEEELGRMIERLRKEEEVMEDDSDFDVEEEDDDEEEDEEVDVVNFEEPVDVVKKEPDTVNETVDRPPDAARTQPSFSLPPVNISLQVSKGCRIGPLFDKTRLRSLPPHNSLPYPEEITRIVQDLLRCGHRPRDIFNSIKVAAPGQPFSIVMFFDRINGKLECKNIPVSDSVISARAWLSEFLESVGCCKNLFILDFIADDFICRHCLTRNQEGKGAVAAESKEMTTVVVEEMRTRVEKKRREEEEKRKEEELKIIKEERKEGENEKLKKEQEEAQKEADSKEVTTVVDPRAEDTEHFAYQAIKVEDEEDVLVDVESCEEELIEDNGDDQKEKLLELEKQETTRDQASEKESPPPVTGSWTASDTASLIASMNEPPLFQVKNEIDDGPSTVTEAPASHLIKKEEPPDDLLNPSSVTNAGPIQDDDKPLKKETDSNPSTSKSKKVVVSIPIPKGLPRSGAMVPNFETLCYSNLNSVFLYLFDIPNERTYLRPDIVNNVISETPGMPLKQFVRVNRQTVGEKEMWQLGEQRPIDSSILKEIKLHRCKNASPLKINGTMLQLWLSLLLHCPKCILMGSWTLAMEKMQGFVAEEEKKWKAKQANEARPETKLAYVRRLAEEKRRKAAVDEMDNEKYYNRLNSIFFQLFCIPDERRYLRPDIRKTQFDPSDATLRDYVRVSVFFCDQKYMWQLGDEKPMDSMELRKINSHVCRGAQTYLAVTGTMLDLWRSLLLHCPKCVWIGCFRLALVKMNRFVKEEKWKAWQLNRAQVRGPSAARQEERGKGSEVAPLSFKRRRIEPAEEEKLETRESEGTKPKKYKILNTSMELKKEVLKELVCDHCPYKTRYPGCMRIHLQMLHPPVTPKHPHPPPVTPKPRCSSWSSTHRSNISDKC